MEELRWRKIKNKDFLTLQRSKTCKGVLWPQWKCGNVEMCTTLKATSPQSPQCAAAVSFSPEFCLWEENRWNLLEVNQAAGESGLHGPLNKKAHECVLHVSFLCGWPVKISLCSSRVLESQAGPPCLLDAILTPNLKALRVLGSHFLSWTTPLDF